MARRIWTPQENCLLIRLNLMGWSDEQVAPLLNRPYTQVKNKRSHMKLEVRWQLDVEKRGVRIKEGKAPAKKRREDLIAARGWPDYLSLQAVRMIEYICDNAPVRRKEMMQALGYKACPRGMRVSNTDNPCGHKTHTALKTLKDAGLLHIVKIKWQSHYFPTMLALEIRRAFLETSDGQPSGRPCDEEQGSSLSGSVGLCHTQEPAVGRPGATSVAGDGEAGGQV